MVGKVGAVMRGVATAIIVLITAADAFAQSAPARYEAALAREKQLRAAQSSARSLRALAAQYEAIVERFPRSGYSDNALWQAAGLSWLAYERYGQDADRRDAVRLLQQLRRSYPGGSLAKQVAGRLSEMTAAVSARRATPRPVTRPVQHAALQKAPDPLAAAADAAPPAAPPAAAIASPAAPATPVIRLTEIARSALPSGERLTIAMDSEPQFHEERIVNPERLFFDFRNTAAAESARPAIERLAGGVVRDVRLGKQPDNVTRLVVELEPGTRHSVFALYNPFRLVVDLERTAAPPAPAAATPNIAPAAPAASPPTVTKPAPRPITDTVPPAANPVRDAGAPVVPATNSNGGFSLAR